MEIDLSKLNPEQRLAVTHGKGPLLIVAGAGTGKTTVVTQRISWLIKEQGLKPEEILALTFTEKAAAEMEERVDKVLPYGFVDLWISTFHAFCERILKAHALDIGLPTDFKLLDQTQSWLLVKKNLNKFDLDYYRPLGSPTKFIHALIKHFSRCKDEEIYPEDYLAYAEELKLNLDNMEASAGQVGGVVKTQQGDLDGNEIKRINEVAGAYHTYQQILLENNALDFGDLINYTLKLFKSRPKILQQYRDQFKYILVDEFQDTNWAQYELIKLLAAPANNITVVGDDDQSIYKFRGASVSNILFFKKDYPEAKEIFLTTNYRSYQNLLDLSYQFITLNNPERLEIKLQEQSKGKSKLSKQLKAAKEGKAKLELGWLPDIDREVKWVVDKIVSLRKKKGLDWSAFAILVRANDAAVDFVKELEAREIPVQFLSSKGLYLKPIILDIINYLHLLDDYRESPALYRILNMPVLELEPEQIVNLNYWAHRKGWSIFEVLKKISTISGVTEKTIREVNKLLGWIEKHTALAKEKPVSQVVMSFLEDSTYLQYVSRLPEEEAKQQNSYLNQFYRKIKEFERSFVENKVSDFLLELDLEMEAGEAGSLAWDIEEGPDTVKVMTIHSAKGLEFDYVFIPNLVDKRFPTISRSDPIELPDVLVKEMLPEGDVHLQEERRLFYVAMTRAKEGVFFSGADDYGGSRLKKPSRFLYEIGMVKEEGKASKAVDKPKEKKEKLLPNNLPRLAASKKAGNLPDTFSYSQLNSFQKCPLQYKFAYVLKVPVRGSHSLSFGQSIHLTLQRFFDLVKSRTAVVQQDLFGNVSGAQAEINWPSLDELLEIYEQTWIDDWYESKEQQLQFKKKGRDALIRFFEEWKKDKVVPQFLERSFKLKLDDYTVVGKIDRIDKTGDDKWEIIDYKTGESKDKLDFKAKEQLLIYQLAAQDLGGQVEKLTYYYLDDGKRVSFLGTDQELDKLRQTMLETIENIRQGVFEPKPNAFVCRHCDFNRICEFAKRQGI